MLISIFYKFSVLENGRKVLEMSSKNPWILHKLACMNPATIYLPLGILWKQLLQQFFLDLFETSQLFLSRSEDVNVVGCNMDFIL